MEWQILGAFVATALFESLSPGPTIALVIDTRVQEGSEGALQAVAGVTLANVAWVVIAFAVNYWHVPALGPALRVLVEALAVPVLMFLACERILMASVVFVSKHFRQRVPATGQGFWKAFFIHFVNPLSPAFYLATFTVVIAGMPWNQAALFGAVPIVMDLIVFGVLAKVPMKLKAEHFPQGVPQLLSGIALFVIVALTLSGARGGAASGSGGAAWILAALLSAALVVASRAATSLKGVGGKVVWRAVGLWDSWFKIAAVAVGILSLSAVFATMPLLEHRIRILSVVAAVVAAALSFAKACGDLQEERSPSRHVIAVPDSAWQASPIWVGLATVGFLAGVFLLITVTGFSLQARPPGG